MIKRKQPDFQPIPLHQLANMSNSKRHLQIQKKTGILFNCVLVYKVYMGENLLLRPSPRRENNIEQRSSKTLRYVFI